MTDKIANPDFEDGGSAGWTNKSMAAQTNDIFSIKHGKTFMEAWTGRGGHIYDVTLSQIITIPNGSYRLTALAQNIQEDTPTQSLEGCYLFADDYKANVGVRDEYTLDFNVTEGQHRFNDQKRQGKLGSRRPLPPHLPRMRCQHPSRRPHTASG